MSRSRFSEQELRLEAERCVKYRGTARVRLEVLHFQWNEPRELSRKNVERLKEGPGCEPKVDDISVTCSKQVCDYI